MSQQLNLFQTLSLRNDNQPRDVAKLDLLSTHACVSNLVVNDQMSRRRDTFSPRRENYLSNRSDNLGRPRPILCTAMQTTSELKFQSDEPYRNAKGQLLPWEDYEEN